MRLLYFAPVPYHSYWQRPHYMVRCLLEDVYQEIYWIDPTITRLPRWSDLSRLTTASEEHAAEPLLPRLTVLQPGGLPIEPLPLFNRLNDWLVWHNIKSAIADLTLNNQWDIGVGRPSRLALWAVRSLPSRARFMDVMDDFPAFYSGLSRFSMQKIESELAQYCDFFFCSEQSLVSKLAKCNVKKSVSLIPNGYDMQRLPMPSKHQPERKIIGFVGTIASWFDWKLVIEMALALPDVTIKLIGPRAGYLPSSLPNNIELLPACTVEEAIQHCQQFTVGLIPFINNKLTESVDPIKYYELRALGIPIWTTSFGSMSDRLTEPEVTEIYQGADWNFLWGKLNKNRPDVDQIMHFRNQNDWAIRFESMPDILGLGRRKVEI
jgi:glycosyltransferase involved in cell wall biosynthesis